MNPHPAQVTDPIRLYTRPREVQLTIIRADAGICRTCDKPLSEAMFAWDHRITTGPGYDGHPFEVGEDRFPCVRHTDGTKPCWTESQDLPKARCGKCKAYESLGVKQEAWGDRVTCRECGDTNWYSIGD